MMVNHTIVETDDCWVIGNIVIKKYKEERDFKVWICNLLYDMKRDAEMERTNDTIHSNLVQ